MGSTDSEGTERLLICQSKAFFFLLAADFCLEQWLDMLLRKS
jgi:hypothetical protein